QVIEGAFKVAPDLSYRPNLVSHATVTTNPFAVTYFIRPEARWNDGVPVGAQDFLFTYRVFSAPTYPGSEKPRYAPIRRVEVVDPETVRVVFTSRDAAWRDLFHSTFPAHVLAGENIANVWTEAIDNPKT